MSKEAKVSQAEINKRIKQVTMEAEFRFKCLELALPLSKTVENLLENSTKIYNYSFHLPTEVVSDGDE